MAVMSQDPDRPGIDLRIWAKPELAPRFGFLTRAQALDLLASGGADAVVVNEAADADAEAHPSRQTLRLLTR
jgi:hypothetical protein